MLPPYDEVQAIPASTDERRLLMGAPPGRSRRKPGLAVQGLACAVMLATTSCSGDASPPREPAPQTGGPILLGGAPATSCISPPEGVADLTYGLEGVAPQHDVELRIEDVALVGPENLEIVEAFFLPGQLALIGNHSSWPPPAELIASDFEVPWATRRPAKGMVIEYRPDGTLAGLVLHVRRPDPQAEAGFKHVQVTYAADGVDYVADSTIEFEAKDRC